MEAKELNLSDTYSPSSTDIFKHLGKYLPSVIDADLTEDWFLSEYYYPQYYRVITKLVRENKERNIKFFEFGVRYGYIPITFKKVLDAQEKTGEYVGIDINTFFPNGLELTKKSLDVLGLKNTLIQSDIKHYNYSAYQNMFDITHIDSEHTWEGKLSDLNNGFDMVKSGGYLMVDDYNYDHIKEPVDYFLNKIIDKVEITYVKTFRGLLLIKKL